MTESLNKPVLAKGPVAPQDANRQVDRPESWISYAPFRPDPAPLWAVLDIASDDAYRFEIADRINVNVRVVTYDEKVAAAVLVDWRKKGHWVELHRLDGGLDEVQPEYD